MKPCVIFMPRDNSVDHTCSWHDQRPSAVLRWISPHASSCNVMLLACLEVSAHPLAVPQAERTYPPASKNNQG